MTRGRRWSVDEEKKLAEFVKAGVTAAEISKRLGRSIVGVHDKIMHLGLEDDEGAHFGSSSSSLGLKGVKVEVEGTSPSLVSSEVLSCPAEALKKVAAAVVALERPDLGRTEIQRLKCIILGAEKYQGLFERVAQYRKLEERFVELEGKYFELVKKQQKT